MPLCIELLNIECLKNIILVTCSSLRNLAGYSFLPFTNIKMSNLLRIDENSIEQCCAAHIVQYCQVTALLALMLF